MRNGSFRPDARVLRATLLLGLLGLAALPADEERIAHVPLVRTGLRGTLIALHAADGNDGHAVATEVDLADLSVRATNISVNDVAGRGDDVVLATGSPAQLFEYRGGLVRGIPGIDMVFLSAPSLAPDRTLAFARDTRREGVGEELWTWDLAKRRGRKIHGLPDGHAIWATRWKDRSRLFALTRADGSRGDPKLLEFVDGRLVRSRRTELGGSFEFGPKGSILQAGSVGKPGFLRRRALWTDLATGRSRELPDGWQPIARSPDGKQMLMASWEERNWIVERTRLGVADTSDPLAITELGSVPGVLFGGYWKGD